MSGLLGYSHGKNVGMAELGAVAWPTMNNAIVLVDTLHNRLQECKDQQADY